MPVLPSTNIIFDAETPIVVIGAGACGLVAALAASGEGADVIILERDALPQGSTALSSGLIPAAATKAQQSQGLGDSVTSMVDDILSKAHYKNDRAMVEAVCRQSAVTIDWLNDTHSLELTVIDSFLYPGHSAYRMHGTPSKTGRELIGVLHLRAEELGIPILTNAHVTDLYTGNDRIRGVRYIRPDGTTETLGCCALILACNGFGGNPEMVAELIPAMKDALYFGHTGNQGDAIKWGRALNAVMYDLGSYQGHGSVAQPHGILISWALMMEGGIQVNALGQRFSNEHDGYSEQARRVIAQPESMAWNIFDYRLHQFALDFDDYREADAAGAIQKGNTIDELASRCNLPASSLSETLAAVRTLAYSSSQDEFGRLFLKPPLQPPYFAVRVTGALFHTQGGLAVDEKAFVLQQDGLPFSNLFAGGGAARGLSGPLDWGYLSGNGLLTAVTLGHLSGQQAAVLAKGEVR